MFTAKDAEASENWDTVRDLCVYTHTDTRTHAVKPERNRNGIRILSTRMRRAACDYMRACVHAYLDQ